MPYRDPFSFPDPFAADPFASAFGGGRRREAAYPPLEEAEARSMIGQLTDTTLSGLGYLGSTLDKLMGGRAIRGGLNALAGGGSARELLSVIPGSDWAGLTRAEDSVTGGELLRNATGYDPSKGNWLERNLVSPAVETALDPSLYLGGIGALNAAGKAAKAAGTLTPGFLGAVRQGERSLHPLLYGLSPAQANATVATVARAATKANSGLRRIPVVPWLEDTAGGIGHQLRLGSNALFDRASGPSWNETVQLANRTAREPARRAAVEAGREQAHDMWQMLEPAFDAGLDRETARRYLTQAGEDVPITTNVGVHQPALDAVVQRFRPLYQAMPGEQTALGLPASELNTLHDIQYMMQQANRAPEVGRGGATAKPFRTTHPSMIRRNESFDLPGGRIELEDYIRDPAMSGAARTMPAADVAETILQSHLRGRFGGGAGPGGIPLAPEVIADLGDRSSDLAGFLGRVKDHYIDLPGRVEPTVPFFKQDPIANFLTRATRGADVTSAARGFHDVVGRVGQLGVGDVTVLKALQDAGLKGEGAYASSLRALRQDPDALIDGARQADLAAGGTGNIDAAAVLREALEPYRLPAVEAREATKLMNRYVTPKELDPVRAALDSSMNLYKGWLYSVWPGSHGRNALSAINENWMEGTAPWSKAYGDVGRMRRGEGIDTGLAAYAHLSPAEQRVALNRELFAKGIIGSPQGELNTRVGVRDAPLGTGNPALPQPGVVADAKGLLRAIVDRKSYSDPRGIAGVGGRQVDTNPLVMAGRDLGQSIEEHARGAEFLDLRRKGYTADAARDAVIRNHFDYCVDESTEMLTRRGWKSLDEVTTADEALGLDPVTRGIRWVPITAVNIFPSPGRLTRWKTTNFDAFTTDNHRWLANGGPKGGHWTLRAAAPKQRFVTTGDIVRGRLDLRLLVGGGIPCAEPVGTPVSDEMAELIAWYVTEGYDSDSKYGMLVSQSLSHNPGYVERIRSIAGHYREAGATVTEYAPRDHGYGPILTFYFGKGIGEVVRGHAPAKRITPELLSCLTPAQLATFKRTLMDGDGMRRPGLEVWTQNDKARVDAFQMVCCMLGIRSNARMNNGGCYNVTAYTRGDRLNTQNLDHVSEEYAGRVWCPTTTTGTWMARRNGVTYWTGNSDISDFEKEWMRRLSLFYTFPRKNLPKQAVRAVTSPSTAMLPLRFSGAMDPEGYIPEYMRSGLAIPLGEADEAGTQSYLSGLGLPFEEAMSRLKVGRGVADTAQQTGMGMLGMLRPELKGPLEFLAGRQFFTGREMKDLVPGKIASVGGLFDDETARPISQLLANSPASRVVSTLNKFLDERKHTPEGVAGLLSGLVTGTRVTDVDLNKWQQIDARRAAERALREEEPIRELSTFYVKPEDKGQITPEQARLMSLNAYIVAKAKEAAKQKKREQQRIGVQVPY